MKNATAELNRLAQWALISLLGWTAVIGYSLYSTIQMERQGAMAMAGNTARANFFKDQAFRLWASDKGGLYAIVNEHNQPVPYMEHVADRDLHTRDGRQLTLMNPASMLREMMDQYAELYGIKGRIVGIVALNPGNKADAWEEKAIRAFERGEKEIQEVSDVGGRPHLRLIRPMIMQPACMKCHGHLGFKIGDVRGAVGVSVPLEEYLAAAATLERQSLLTHGVIWVVGLMGGGFFFRGQGQRIRERDASMRALRESEERAQLALEGAGAGAWDWNIGANELFLSPRLKAQLGYADAEMENAYASWESRVHPDDLPRVLAALTDYLEGRAPEYNLEYRMRAKDGEYRWINARGKITQRDADGKPSRMIGIHDDVTTRKLAELALENRIIALTRPLDAAEDIRFEDIVNLPEIQRLQDLFADAFGVASLITAPDGTPITRPSNFSRLCGQLIRTNEEGVKRCEHSDSILGRYNPEGPNVQHCLSAGLCNAGASITVGNHHVANWLIGQVRDESHQEGTIIRFAQAIGGDESQFVSAFRELPTMPKAQFDKVARVLFAVANQISTMAYQNIQQARFIAERKRAEAELLESQARYREAQSLSHLGHWFLETPAWRFQWLSEETLRLFEFDPKQEHPDHDAFIRKLHPDDRKRVEKTLESSIASGEPFEIEYRVQLEGGATRYLASRGKAHRNEAGQVEMLSGTVMDVTERHLAEEHLKTFQALAEASVDAIVMADPETAELTYANQAAHEMFGCDFNGREMVGRNGGEFWPAEDLETMGWVISRGISEGWRGDVRQVRRNGQRFDANITVFAIGGSAGYAARIVAIIRDITDKKLAEQALQIANAKLESIIDFLPDATFVVDADGRVIAWNRAMERMTGMAKAELLGRDDGIYAHAFYGESRPMLIDLVLQPATDGQALYRTFERRGDALVAEGETPEVYGGRGAYVWATAIPLKDSKGQVIGAIECVRDITDSKRAELALRESEERLRFALEGTSDGIWDWDFNTGRTYFSPRYYTMLGYAPDEFPATYENWRKLLHPDDLAVAETAIQDYLQGQTPAFSVEFRCRTKDGGWRWILGRGKVVERDASGAPVRLAGSHSDISARKRVEEALRLTQFTVDQASEAIFWFDTQGRFNYVNEEACRMLGYSHDELVGMSIPDVDITIPAAGLASVIDNLSQSGLLKLDSVLRHKDGRLLNVAITGRYLHFAGQSRMVAHIRDITDQKRAEEALRLIRFGVERSADAVYLIDPNNRFLDVNEAACAVLGYSRDELLSMGIVDIDSGVSDEMATELFERLREKGRLRMETRHRRKEGTTFPVEIMANYVEFGGREYNFCFVRDLTERKAAEAALHLTRRAIDAAAMAFEWYDDSGRIVDVNQQTCVELGFSREEMLSKHLSDIDPNFPAERWPEVWSRIKEQGALSIDTLHRRKDGATFPVQVTANFVAFEGREYVFSYAQDLTERRRAEETLRLTQFAIDHSSAAFEWLSAEGEVIASNIEAPRALGYGKEEFVGLRVWDYDPDFSPARWQEFWAELKREGSVTAETRHRRKDGSTFPIEVTANHVRFGDKEFCFAYITDISKRKEAEQALLELNATLEGRVHEEVAKNRDKDHLLIQQSRLAAMGEMMGNIAHQWRQPINALSLVLANIKDAHDFDQLDEAYLEGQMARGVNLIHKMSTTIDDFRNFFRPDRASQAFSLAKAARDAMMIVELSYAHAKIELVFEADEEVRCFGLPNEYAQVVLNLLANAKDAIQERRETGGRVALRIEKGEREGRLVMADNGGGIDEAVLPKVFDPYFTTRDKGTGIGLYMSRMIIENMGGHIEVANVDGGARVTLTTPLAAVGQGSADSSGASK